MLSDLVLFDVYVGDQIGAGRKSLAYSLEFQPLDRTLTDREIDAEVARIVHSCRSSVRSEVAGDMKVRLAVPVNLEEISFA